MPLFPKLVGGVTVREKPRRRANEPTYRRLEFVRPKEPGEEETDSWPIIRSTEPVRGIVPYQPAYYSAWNPDMQHYYPNQAAAYAARQGTHWSHPAVQGRYLPGHPIYRIPTPALTNGFQPGSQLRAIEPRKMHEDNEFVEIIEKGKKKGGKKGGKGKKEKKVQIGHAIFEDSSESESEYEYVKTKKRHHKHR